MLQIYNPYLPDSLSRLTT